MKQRFNFFVLSVLVLAILVPLLQAQMSTKEPPEVLISIYQVAPGKHLEFLKWQAANEAVNKEAGVASTQWYIHTNGGAWDYLSIGPIITDEQQKKVDDIAKKKGLATAFKASLQFRQFINTHTDTYAMGPVSAADLVQAAE